MKGHVGATRFLARIPPDDICTASNISPLQVLLEVWCIVSGDSDRPQALASRDIEVAGHIAALRYSPGCVGHLASLVGDMPVLKQWLREALARFVMVAAGACQDTMNYLSEYCTRPSSMPQRTKRSDSPKRLRSKPVPV
jgi:hypothetical protein